MTAAHVWVPPTRTHDDLDAVADVAELMGRPLDDDQREAVAALTSWSGDEWAALEGVIIEPRQNGKTAGIITPIVFTDLFASVGPPDRVVWTAHKFKTCVEAFEDHLRLIEKAPELDRRVARVAQANGEEGIYLKDGNRIEYLARSMDNGRGLGGKRVVIDEALVFTPEQADALFPVLAARPNPSILYGSSAAKAHPSSDYLRSLVRRGRAGGDDSLILVEHCAPGSWEDPPCRDGVECSHRYGEAVGCVLDDEDYWALANSALRAGRVKLRTLRAFRRTLSPLGFGREFLGWHEAGDGGAANPVPLATWDGLADPGSTFVGRPCMSVAVSKDSKSAAVAAAGWREDGLIHVEIVDYRPGDGWVAERCGEIREKHRPRGWAFDEKTATAALARDLKAQRVRLREMNTTEAAQACALLLSLTKRGRLRHLGDPRLHEALDVAARRDIGEGWAWAPKRSDGDVVALVAATQAVWLLDSTPTVRVASRRG